MNRPPNDGPTVPCPARRTLLAYQAGRVSGPEAERVAGHLETCVPCVSTLRELIDTPADSFEANLLKFCTDRSYPLPTSQPAYIRLEAAALDLWNRDTQSVGDSAVESADWGVTSLGSVGPYTILGVLGRGGMGIVLRAFHPGLKRPVALKTLHPGSSVRTHSQERFRIEGEAVARLDHPNIVRVYDSGESGGQPYLAMELVEGETLSAKLGRDIMDCMDAAKLVRFLARAVAYAHDQGVIHRDLKPSNVLLTRAGTPKIVDFGLARMIGDDGPQLTASDAIMGTPSYMSPEQAAGRTADINEQTDVYALGVILYEALTGAPPFVAESKLRVMQMVQKGEIIPPSRLRPEVPRDLETICLHCLEASQKDRYRNAHKLDQELDSFIGGKTIGTRRPNRWRWVGRAARRRVPAALAVLMIAGGLIGATAALLPRQAMAIPNGESASVRRELEAELDKGKPVTLVGDTGWPKWFRWLSGKDKQRMQIELDGTICAEIPDPLTMGLLELLPDTRNDRYKLTAEIRQEYGRYGGFVGMYVGYRVYPRDPKDIQFFSHVWFNSIATAPITIIKNDKRQIAENQTHVMSLAARLHTDEAYGLSQELAHASGGRMAALGERNGVWHPLEMTVTPDEVTATVSGHTMTLSKADLSPDSLYKSAPWRRGAPRDEAIQKLRPEFAPKGGLGLIISCSSAASIRRVVVTPLPVVP